MSSIVLPLLMCAVMGVFGDVMCKYAVAAESGHRLAYTVAAGASWAMTSFAWVAVYRSKSMLEIVVLYTPIYSVFVGVVGMLVFGDSFTPKLVLGAVLSALAVWVMQ